MLYPQDGCARLIHYWDSHDDDVATILDAVLAPGMTAIDIGANIGAFTILASERVGAEGKVFAFEPDPETFAKLQRNVTLNDRRNVTCVNAAVGSRSGYVHLSQAEESSQRHVLLDNHVTASLEIPMVSVDEFLDGSLLPDVDYAKVDVEGYEIAVLDGAARALKEGRISFWQIECADALQARYGGCPGNVHQILRTAGYARVAVGGGELLPLDMSARASGDEYFLLNAARRCSAKADSDLPPAVVGE